MHSLAHPLVEGSQFSKTTKLRLQAVLMGQHGHGGNGRGSIRLATSGACCAPEVTSRSPVSQPRLTITRNSLNGSSVIVPGRMTESSLTFDPALRRRYGSVPPPWFSTTSASQRRVRTVSVWAVSGAELPGKSITVSRTLTSRSLRLVTNRTPIKSHGRWG